MTEENTTYINKVIALRIAMFGCISVDRLRGILGVNKSTASRHIASFFKRWPNPEESHKKFKRKIHASIENLGDFGRIITEGGGSSLLRLLESQNVYQELYKLGDNLFFDVKYHPAHVYIKRDIPIGHVQEILKSFSTKSTLKFLYVSRTKDSSEAKIHSITPIAIFSYADKFYLRGYDKELPGEDKFRSFAITRMAELKCGDPLSAANASKQINKELTTRVMTLRINPALPKRVRDRLFEDFDVDIDGTLTIKAPNYLLSHIKMELCQKKVVDDKATQYWIEEK